MAGSSQEITFSEVRFDSRATGDLWEIEGMTSARLLQYQKDIDAGRVRVVGVSVAGQRRATFLYSLQRNPEGQIAFVIHEMGGRTDQGVVLVDATEMAARQMAKSAGASVMRFWTKRTGFIRRLQDRFELNYVLEGRV